MIKMEIATPEDVKIEVEIHKKNSLCIDEFERVGNEIDRAKRPLFVTKEGKVVHCYYQDSYVNVFNNLDDYRAFFAPTKCMGTGLGVVDFERAEVYYFFLLRHGSISDFLSKEKLSEITHDVNKKNEKLIRNQNGNLLLTDIHHSIGTWFYDKANFDLYFKDIYKIE